MLIPKPFELVKSIEEGLQKKWDKRCSHLLKKIGARSTFSPPLEIGDSPLFVYLLMMELATMLATRLRIEATEPSSLGWTRFVRNISKVSVSGSIQMEVPV